VGISRDYPLKIRTSKQPIGEISGYEIIPSHPLKYPKSKQGLAAPVGIKQSLSRPPVFLSWQLRLTPSSPG
jgi:hypothetical protein